jgi:hypothetical protein
MALALAMEAEEAVEAEEDHAIFAEVVAVEVEELELEVVQQAQMELLVKIVVALNAMEVLAGVVGLEEVLMVVVAVLLGVLAA